MVQHIHAYIPMPTTQKQAIAFPYIVVLICFAACFIKFPGAWDNDTVAQHAQMLAGVYEDWHPPVFAAFWKILNAIWNRLSGMEYTGSGVLYSVHAIMLWGGLALMARAAQGFFRSFVGKPLWALLSLSAFLLFFGLYEMVPMSRFVFKDTAMMAAYILALGIMLTMPAGLMLRLAATALCLLLLFYGTAVRHNAIFALIPMLMLLCKAWPTVKPPIALMACAALWVGILGSIHCVNYELLHAQKNHPFQEIIYVDFWKLNYETKSFDVPPLPEGQSWEPLTEDIFFRFYDEKPLYYKQAFRFIREYYGETRAPGLYYDFSGDPQSFGRLRNAWLEKITQRFGTYVGIHKKIFTNLLSTSSFMGLSGTWYFTGAALIVLAGLARTLRGRTDPIDPAPFLVAASALLYAAPYMIALPDIQRRYLYWFFFGCFFGIVYLATAFISGRGFAHCLSRKENAGR